MVIRYKADDGTRVPEVGKKSETPDREQKLEQKWRSDGRARRGRRKEKYHVIVPGNRGQAGSYTSTGRDKNVNWPGPLPAARASDNEAVQEKARQGKLVAAQLADDDVIQSSRIADNSKTGDVDAQCPIRHSVYDASVAIVNNIVIGSVQDPRYRTDRPLHTTPRHLSFSHHEKRNT